jgi:predicted Na+-dependent transporter
MIITVLGIAKHGISVMTGVGAAKIVKYAIEKVVPEVVSKTDNLLIIAGSTAIGVIISSGVSTYVENFIDENVDAIKKAVEKIKEEKVVVEQTVNA